MIGRIAALAFFLPGVGLIAGVAVVRGVVALQRAPQAMSEADFWLARWAEDYAAELRAERGEA